VKVKNVSSRLHHVGDVLVVPGEIAEVEDTYSASINRDELITIAADVAPALPVAPAGKGKGAAAPAPLPAQEAPAAAVQAPWAPPTLPAQG
jgi:hypothetical protein